LTFYVGSEEAMNSSGITGSSLMACLRQLRRVYLGFDQTKPAELTLILQLEQCLQRFYSSIIRDAEDEANVISEVRRKDSAPACNFSSPRVAKTAKDIQKLYKQELEFYRQMK
jgi:hypothetical protein